MKRHCVLFTVIFFVMLLLPASWDFVHSLRNGESFAPFDIFRDAVSPVRRELLLAREADSLERGIFEMDSTIDLENIVSNLKRNLVTVNAYLSVDSTDSLVRQVSRFQDLLSELETDEALRDSVKSEAKKIRERFSGISWRRIAQAWGEYGFLCGKYLRAYEDRLEKENAFVKRTRPFYQSLAWNVLRDPGEKALRADSGFLFYRQDVEFLVRPHPWKTDSLDNPVEAVLAFRAELEKRGVELLVVVVPGKPSIYPEFLNPTMYGASGDGISPGLAFLDSLESHGVLTVNLYSVLRKEKLRDSERDFLYLNTDTHWTPRGAEVVAKAVASKVRKLPFYAAIPKEALTDSLVLVKRKGDIATMADLESEFPMQAVEAYVVKNAKGPLRSDFRKAQILILGDSFSRIYETDSPMSAGWISRLAKNLQVPVSAIVSDGGASTLVREKLARRSGVLKNKKLLIWEFVERDLRFGAEGWKKVRLE